MLKQLNKINYKVKIITPVYIGISDSDKIDAMEYIEVEDRVDFFRQEDVMKSICAIDDFIELIGTEITTKKNSMPSLERLKRDGFINELISYRSVKKLKSFSLEGKDIYPTMKSLNVPIIPGSTLKGYFRSVSTFSMIKQMSEEKLQDTLSQYFEKRAKSLGIDDFIFRNISDKGRFYKDIKADAFKYILVDDICFDKDHIALAKEEIYSKSKKDIPLNVIEVILPEEKEEVGRIIIDDRYQYDKAIQTEYIKQITSKKFFQDLYEFSEMIFEEEQRFFEKTEYDTIIKSQLLSQLKAIRQMNTPSTPIIRLGKNKGYLWNTISLYVRNKLPEFYQRHISDFGSKNMNFFPSSRKYLLTRDKASSFGYIQLCESK